jgi:SAM-dependent methyltransferase
VTGPASPGFVFDRVADTYDEVRPAYPDGLYDELERAVGGLAGRRVVDVAAGPGTASRQLAARGARVVAVDPGPALLARLVSTSPVLGAVRGRAEALPLRDGSVDVVTCATAFHWFDADAALAEVRRVLAPGGSLALWWANLRHGDGIDWEDAQSAVYDRWELQRGSLPSTGQGLGPWDAADELADRGWTVTVARRFEWERQVTREQHLRLLSTHSNLLLLDPPDAARLLHEIEQALAPWPELTERVHGPLVVARLPQPR